MKKVRLSAYDHPNPRSSRTKEKRYYRLWLPSGEECYGQEKQLLKRLADVNKWLNAQIRDINHLTGEVYAEFRFYWFNIETLAVAEISRSFLAIDQAISLLIDRSGNYGNAYAFQRLRVVLNMLEGIVKLLAELPMNASIGPMRYRLSSIGYRIERITEEMHNPAPISDNAVTR